jgi:nucleoside triphosphate pyrophosphatase
MGISIVLASSSPRRKELLEGLGLEFEIVIPEADESHKSGESPDKYALRLSKEKALSGAEGCEADSIVIGADTIVVVDGEVLGKPLDEREAYSMLRKISGREHLVLTAFSLVRPATEILHGEVIDTRVLVKTLEPGEIEGYIKTGEPMDKAGAYGIQGIGAFMIKEIRGSYTNVVGLPLVELLEALKLQGVCNIFSVNGFKK